MGGSGSRSHSKSSVVSARRSQMISTSESQESPFCIAFKRLFHTEIQYNKSCTRTISAPSAHRQRQRMANIKSENPMHARTTYARLAASICIVATVERRRLWSQPNVRRWIECCSSHSISVRADSTYKANARSSERKSKRRRKKQCWVHKHFDKQKQKKNSISKIKSCQSSWLLFYFRFGFFFSIRNAHGSPIAQSFHFESMALILFLLSFSSSDADQNRIVRGFHAL